MTTAHALVDDATLTRQLDAAIAADDALAACVSVLRHAPRDQVSTVVRRAMQAGRQREVLNVLNRMEPARSLDVVDHVVDAAACQTHLARAAAVLGRVSYRDAERVVAPAIWRVLERECDQTDTWNYLATVLAMLGLYADLHHLVRRAAAGDDPDMHDIADLFADTAATRPAPADDGEEGRDG